MEVNSNDNMLIYRSEDGKIKIDVRFESETVWLSLDQMATLFGRDKSHAMSRTSLRKENCRRRQLWQILQQFKQKGVEKLPEI